MPDISMCRNTACPMRLLCERHVDAGVFKLVPGERQSLGSFAPDERGFCSRFAPRCELRPWFEAVPAEVWKKLDVPLERKDANVLALLLAALLPSPPMDSGRLLALANTRLRWERWPGP